MKNLMSNETSSAQFSIPLNRRQQQTRRSNVWETPIGAAQLNPIRRSYNTVHRVDNYHGIRPGLDHDESEDVPHWFQHYNRIHRRRLEYMKISNRLQADLKMHEQNGRGGLDNQSDCLRSRVLQQKQQQQQQQQMSNAAEVTKTGRPSRYGILPKSNANTSCVDKIETKGPLLWNSKACTCTNCLSAAMLTYYPGILYLSTHRQQHNNVYNPANTVSLSTPSIAGGTSGFSNQTDQLILNNQYSKSNRKSNNTHFQTVIENTHKKFLPRLPQLNPQNYGVTAATASNQQLTSSTHENLLDILSTNPANMHNLFNNNRIIQHSTGAMDKPEIGAAADKPASILLNETCPT